MTATVNTKKGTKTNERPGTRATAKFVRSSAYKAREVLDLIRDKSYGEAAEILLFSERGISEVVAKVLDSAAANAENNDGIPVEELYVAACFADEGPTLKRWRPRARGRATRIRKRTCHITVIVGRYSPEQLETMRAREAQRGQTGKSTSAAEARRRRVAQSRQRAEAAPAAEAEAEHDHDHDDEEAVAEVETTEVDETTDDAEVETAETAEVDETTDGVEVETTDDESTDVATDAEASADGSDEPVEDEEE